ncbi:MAG: hypothetical protein ACI4PV_06385, partial [Butyricicoccus sp.]
NVTPDQASDKQIYQVLSAIIVEFLKGKRQKYINKVHSDGKKQIYYLSMEFLMGRSLKTSLYNLEIVDEVQDMLKEYGVKLVVGLITGWMSGRLFIPPALYGKNLYTDPQALMLEGYFIKGFISALKDKPAIYAWDLGNECNCMERAEDRFTAASWTACRHRSCWHRPPSMRKAAVLNSLTTSETSSAYCAK